MVAGGNNYGPSASYDFYRQGVHSGQEGLFTPFFGPPAKEQKLSAWEQRSHQKWNMTDAFVGQNKTLRDTLEDLMLTAQFDWYTERVMPWYKTDDLHLQWTEWDTNPHYMGITPHQAAPRTTTQKRTLRKASIVRRGIASEFEQDFVRTAIGRTSFVASLGQMARSVQETANVEVIRSLLHCHYTQQEYHRQYQIIKDYELDEYHERVANRFAITQKDEQGLEHLTTEIEREMEVYGAKADVWILDRALFDYTQTVPENKILYYKGGQEAVDRLNGRPSGQQAAGGTMGNLRRLDPPRMVRDTPVFICKSFHIENLGKADLLSRVMELGVYNTMIDRNADYNDYTSRSRRLRVYDEDIDNWTDIDFEFALRHCIIWDKDGNLRDVFSKRNGMSHATQSDGDFDFLSYKTASGDRKNIQYIGEMPLHYQSEHDLLDAAQTMLNAITYGDKDVKQTYLKNFNTSATQTDIREKLQTLVGRFENQFKDGLGSDDDFKANFVNLTKAPAREANALSEAQISPLQAQAKFLQFGIGAPLPATYQTRVQRIAQDAQRSWQERAEAIKSMVVDAKNKDPSSMQLQTDEQINEWFDRSVSDFDQHLASMQTASSEAVRGEVQYFPVDQPLPKGYRWVNPNVVGKSVVQRMPMFQQTKSSASQSAGVRRAFIGHNPVLGSRTGRDSEELAKDIQKRNELTKGDAPTTALMDNIVEKITKTGAHPLLQALAVLYAGMPFKRDVLCNLIKLNIAVKLGLLLQRPHCTFRTKYGIKCLSGGGAGYTFFGHSDMQLEHEAARKVGMMSYTTYLSAVVLYPKNVYVVEDMYCEKYLGGHGTDFWSVDRYTSGSLKRTAADIICVPLPPSRKRLEQKIDVRGRWYTENRRKLVSKERFSQPLFEGAARVNLIMKWYDPNHRNVVLSRSRHPINYVCWQGMQWYWNDKLNRFDDYTVQSGHLGHEVGPGVGKVLNGAMNNWPKFGYNQHSR